MIFDLKDRNQKIKEIKLVTVNDENLRYTPPSISALFVNNSAVILNFKTLKLSHSKVSHFNYNNLNDISFIISFRVFIG